MIAINKSILAMGCNASKKRPTKKPSESVPGFAEQDNQDHYDQQEHNNHWEKPTNLPKPELREQPIVEEFVLDLNHDDPNYNINDELVPNQMIGKLVPLSQLKEYEQPMANSQA